MAARSNVLAASRNKACKVTATVIRIRIKRRTVVRRATPEASITTTTVRLRAPITARVVAVQACTATARANGVVVTGCPTIIAIANMWWMTIVATDCNSHRADTTGLA